MLIYLLDPIVDVKNNDGKTPLDYANENFHFDIVKLLIGSENIEK